MLLGQQTLQGQISFQNSNASFGYGAAHSGVPIAVADMNADGLDDIIHLDDARILMIEYQKADGTGFTKHTVGVVSGNYQWSMCVADVDNNGFNDVMTAGSFDEVKLYKANADGTAYAYSTLPGTTFFAQASNFADINNDGWLDAFVCNDNAESRIWGNDGTGQLLPADDWINMATVPVSNNSGNYGSVWSDFDSDGDVDLYIAKCRQGETNPASPLRINALFENDGSGNYTETAAAHNLNIGAQSWTGDFGDIDNDGDFDCLVTNHDAPHMLMLNDGNNNFTNIASTSGLSFSGFALQGVFRDFDNDGFLDILLSNSTKVLLRNNGNNTFTHIETAFAPLNYLHSFAIGDLNHDGLLDVYGGYGSIYTTPTTNPDIIWLNNTQNNNHFLEVTLQGVNSNVNGVGARITAYGPWGQQIREVRAGESYGIMNSFTQHFGLGDATVIDSLAVNWPSGQSTTYYNVAADQFLSIREDNCILPVADISIDGPTVFCPGQSATLSAEPGYTYQWSTGETSQSIAVSETGSYQVVVFTSEQCSVVSDSVTITVDPELFPTVTALGDTVYCKEGSVVLQSDLQAASYLWSTGETSPDITVTTTGDYAVTVPGLCREFSSPPVHIEIIAPEAPLVKNDTVYNVPGPATLIAFGDNPHWYDSQTGGQLIYIGDTLSIPLLTQTTTYYIEDPVFYPGSIYFAGQPAFTGTSPFSGNNFNGDIVFDAFVPFAIKKTKVYTDVAGPRVIELLGSNGALLDSDTVYIASGESTIELDIDVPAGINLKLTTNSAYNLANFGYNSPRLQRSSGATVVYPYTVPDVLSIKGATLGQNIYYYFYNWEIQLDEQICTHDDRVGVSAVFALVDCSPPVLDFMVNPASACAGDIVAITAIIENATTGQYQLEWNTGESGATIHKVLDSDTSFFVVAMDPVCAFVDTFSVEIAVGVRPAAAQFDETTILSCAGLAFSPVVANTGPDQIIDWYNQPTGGVPIASANAFAPDEPGIYYAETRNLVSNGCVSAARTAVAFVSNPPIQINLTADTAICPGISTTIFASANGGTGNLQFLWSDNLGTEPLISVSPQVASTYSVSVTDSNNCVVSNEVTISVFPAVSVFAGGDQSLCFGDSTVLSAIAAGGNGIYNFEWDHALGTGSMHLITPTQATAYTVSVTDGNGCTNSDEVAVDVFPELLVSIADRAPLCAGQSVLILTTVSGGSNSSYTYSWNQGLPPISTHVDLVDTTTTYRVTVTDSNGCQASDAMTVIVLYPPTAFAGTDQSLCVGASAQLNGSVGNGATTGVWSASVPGGNFQLGVNNLDNIYTPPPGFSGIVTLGLTTNAQAPCPATTDVMTLTVNSLPQLIATADTCALDLTTYTLVLSTDATNLMTDTGTVESYGNGVFSINGIPEETNVNATLINTATGCSSHIAFNGRNCECPQIAAPQATSNTVFICQGEPLPALSVVVDANLSVLWYAAQGGGVPIHTGAQFTPDSAGVYYAEAVDETAFCVSSTRTAIALVIKERPVANAGEDQLVCPNALVTLHAEAGENYEYLWNNGAQTQDVLVEASELSLFVLTVTQNGCTAQDTVIVDLLNPPSGELLLLEPISCPGASDGVLGVVSSGEHPPFTVLWSTGSGAAQIGNLSAGSYSVAITDTLGCSSTDSIVLEDPEGFTITSVIQNATGGQANGSIEITIESSSSGAFAFSWSNEAGFSANTEDIFDLFPGNYTLIVTDTNGCQQVQSFMVDNITGIRPLATGHFVQLFPNPSNGEFWLDFKLPEAREAEIAILDVFGQPLKTFAMQNIRQLKIPVDLKGQPSGVYLIKIKLGADSISLKAVKK